MVVASLIGSGEWGVGSGESENIIIPLPIPHSRRLLIRFLFLLRLFFVVFVLFVLFVVFVLFVLFVLFVVFVVFVLFALSDFGVFLRAFLVVGQPFGVNSIGLATFFFGDQPLAALVPPFTAFRLFMTEQTIFRAELLRLAQKQRIGPG